MTQNSRSPLVVPSEEEELFARLAAESVQWTSSAGEILAAWAKTIDECTVVYAYGLDDYTNDLTVREHVQRVLDADQSKRLKAVRLAIARLDRRFRSVTVPLERPVFAADLAEADPDKFFFYYRIPRLSGEEFVEDLIRMKLIRSTDDLPPGNWGGNSP